MSKIIWYGNLNQKQFLEKIYDLTQFESTDPRYKDASGDIIQHTINNNDWEDDWIFSDKRFDLLNCPDSIFIQFLENTIYPLVRSDKSEIDKLVKFYKVALKQDGYEIYTEISIDNKNIFKIRKKLLELDKRLKIIIVSHPSIVKHQKSKAPCIVLVKDNWDDYNFNTLFAAFFLNEEQEELKLGYIKITDGKHTTTQTCLDNEFFQLPKNFISLGESMNYYEKVFRLGRPVYTKILSSLNDIVYKPELLGQIKESKIFKISLLRSSDAEKAYKEAGKYFEKDYIKFEDSLDFKFTTIIKGSESKQDIIFNFKDSLLPHRINILIGKNGTGKTQIIANLANALSGAAEKGKISFGSFEPRPTFSKIITFSYSVFDNFYIASCNKILSYKYCGIRKDSDSLLTSIELKKKFLSTFSLIGEKNRRLDWEKIINQIIDFRVIFSSIDQTTEKEVESKYDKLSSGQKIILTLLTEVIGFIESESLLLFDEPELHLHPNGIVSFITMLSSLLERFNSYAIIATHSPLILQQIPSRYISVLKRDGNNFYQSRLMKETFGESFSLISEEVFDTLEAESNYKEVLEKLSIKHSYKKITSIFNNKLSLNAKVFIKSLNKTNETS